MEKTKLALIIGTYAWLFFLLIRLLARNENNAAPNSIMFILIMIGIFTFLNIYESKSKLNKSYRNILFLILSLAFVIYYAMKILIIDISKIEDSHPILAFLYTIYFYIFLVVYPTCQPPIIHNILENRFGKYGELLILLPFTLLLILILVY